jgi:hypothetical protein
MMINLNNAKIYVKWGKQRNTTGYSNEPLRKTNMEKRMSLAITRNVNNMLINC